MFPLQADRDKDVSGAWKKKNGLIQRQRPAGSESPQQVDSSIQYMNNRRDTAIHVCH